MQRFNITTDSYYTITIRKVVNGIIVNVQGQEYVFQGNEQEIKQKIQQEMPEIANLINAGE